MRAISNSWVTSLSPKPGYISLVDLSDKLHESPTCQGCEMGRARSKRLGNLQGSVPRALEDWAKSRKKYSSRHSANCYPEGKKNYSCTHRCWSDIPAYSVTCLMLSVHLTIIWLAALGNKNLNFTRNRKEC